jgi:hypothetical protein
LSEDLNWKTGLLGSGLPLEHEAARLLVSKGFRVDSDFKYARTDHGEAGRFSVNLHAKAFAPFSDPKRATAALDLVVECRHTRPDVGWLFLPDPNPPAGPPAASGHTIRVIDEFSLSSVDAGATAAFEAEMAICCKGLRIDLAGAAVDDAEISRGLVQLQYALPRLMVESVLLHFSNQAEQNVPFLFCPVLLTTAPLLVARGDLGVEEVERSSELGELAAEVPYLVVISDYGPDFQSHCRREFGALEKLERDDDLLMIETKRAGLYESQRGLPVATIESLIAADPYRLQSLFTRFIVCTRSELPALVTKIQQAAETAMQSRKELQ